MELDLLPQTAYIFILMFARLGTIMMLMPAVGEKSIPPRIRLTTALLICLVLYPSSSVYFGKLPDELFAIAAILAHELLVGFAIGLCLRMLMATLQIAGTVIAFQMSLSMANSMDPSQPGVQSAVVASFLSLIGITIIFTTNLHHLALVGLHDSYVLFSPSSALPVEDFAALALNTIVSTFKVGIQISGPFIVFGLVFYIGLGLLARLMPQLQIFFIAMPAAIAIGLILLAILLGTMMMWYHNYAEIQFSRFLAD